MSVLDKFISSVNASLPERCSVQDLVEIGIFSSAQAAFHARKVGDSPPYFKLGRKIMYLREGVVIWLNGKKHDTIQSFANQENAPISITQRVDECGRQRMSL